jgi:hypothetical protein
LTEEDDFTCIDIDVKDASNEPDPKKWTTQEQFNRQWRICQAFNSYVEYSKSGKGLHIWVRGKIGPGLRRDGVEIYSQERFIICTGNVLMMGPLSDKQELLDILATEIRGSAAPSEKVELVEVDDDLTDSELIERAMSASNADKFNALCRCTSKEGDVHGTYTELGYKSQSEADLALLSMFTFYSKSNTQCRRLFRMSGLGKRDKATQDDRYLDFTLRTIRTRQAGVEKVDASAIAVSAQHIPRTGQDATLLHVPGPPGVEVTAPPPAAGFATLGPAPPPTAAQSGGLPWPPGVAGQIAQFIYQSAPRPVKEVAIVAAIGFLAGVCGKAFCIPQSGLNLYMVLIARSAIGKEAMHSGIAALITAAASRQPPVMRFVDFNDFASGPALSKAVAANPSFVNVAGEWGKKLKRMANEDGRDTPMQALRTVMTNLYQKSGPQSIVGGISYSNVNSNIGSVSGVAYSMIGESTPDTFYQALTQGMMEDGFLSRFSMIEYNGERPPLNTAPLREPNKALGDLVADICTYAMTLIDRQETVHVDRTADAAEVIHQFELECDAEINSSTDEMWRQMWNRASLKMMRIAALIATADNHLNPLIHIHHTTWALDVVRRDIAIMSRRIESGDVGSDDDTRERKLALMIREYLDTPVPAGYNCPDSLRTNIIIPRKYIQQRVARMPIFSGHRSGATVAMDLAIKSLCDSGYIIEVDKVKIAEKFQFHSRCFRILHIPDYSKNKKKPN